MLYFAVKLLACRALTHYYAIAPRLFIV